MYEENKAADGKVAVVLGAGPCGLRLAMELQMLGARTIVVEKREQMMSRLMAEGLLHIPNKEARAVWSWPEADKLSSQWLLALPYLALTDILL